MTNTVSPATQRRLQQRVAALEKRLAESKLKTAEHILYMWNEPWSVTQKPFIDNLKAYIEELKK